MPKKLDEVKRWIESWHVLVSTIFYIGAIFAAAIGGLIALVTFVLSFVNRTDKSQLQFLYDPFGSLLGERQALFLLQNRWSILSGCTLLALAFAAVHHRRAIRKLKSMRLLGEIAHEYNALLSTLRAQTIAHTSRSEQHIRDLSENIHNFLGASANRISAFFELYTGARCHVSVKLYKQGKIKTITRDQRSIEDRGKIDAKRGWYLCQGITQYESIVSEKAAGGFRCNHLWLASKLGWYKNPRPDWAEYYSALVIIPITGRADGKVNTEAEIWGFLCVDNRRGRLDESSEDILRSFAQMYHFIFGIIASMPEWNF
jgi:hypothetical protein